MEGKEEMDGSVQNRGSMQVGEPVGGSDRGFSCDMFSDCASWLRLYVVLLSLCGRTSPQPTLLPATQRAVIRSNGLVYGERGGSVSASG